MNLVLIALLICPLTNSETQEKQEPAKKAAVVRTKTSDFSLIRKAKSNSFLNGKLMFGEIPLITTKQKGIQRSSLKQILQSKKKTGIHYPQYSYSEKNLSAYVRNVHFKMNSKISWPEKKKANSVFVLCRKLKRRTSMKLSPGVSNENP